MDIAITIIFIYLGVGIVIAWYCIIDDLINYHILSFNFEGILTVISLGLLWPSTIYKLWMEK